MGWPPPPRPWPLSSWPLFSRRTRWKTTPEACRAGSRPTLAALLFRMTSLPLRNLCPSSASVLPGSGTHGVHPPTVYWAELLARDPSLWYMRPAFWNSVAMPRDLALQRTILIETAMMEFLLPDNGTCTVNPASLGWELGPRTRQDTNPS